MLTAPLHEGNKSESPIPLPPREDESQLTSTGALSIHSITKTTPATNSPAKTNRTIDMPSNSKIKSIKFLSDTTFLVLITNAKTTRLLRIPFDANTSGLVNTIFDCSEESGFEELVVQTWDGKDGFVPVEMVVNGRKGRSNVLVVAEGYRRWRIYSLEERGGGDGEEEEEEEEEDSMVF